MKLPSVLMVWIAVSLGTACTAQNDAQRAAQPKTNAAPATAAKSPHVKTEGERIFAQNCARCHQPPEGIPPSVSATVVRHMRVRASLSAHEEQELMRFFNP